MLRTGLKEMQRQTVWNWGLGIATTIKMRLTRPLMTSLDGCVVSACSPSPPSIKALTPDCLGSGVGFWTEVLHHYTPGCWLKIKQTFLSTNLASLSALSGEQLDPTLDYTPTNLPLPRKQKDQLAQSYKASKSLDPVMDSWPCDIHNTFCFPQKRAHFLSCISSHIPVSPTLSEGWETWFIWPSTHVSLRAHLDLFIKTWFSGEKKQGFWGKGAFLR